MIDQRKRIFAIKLWLLDLVLTAASFFLAYGLRLLFQLEGHIVLELRIYVWLLAIILPTWAAILPLFGVYSDLTRSSSEQIGRLTKAIVVAWLVMVTAQFFFHDKDQSNRLIVLFTAIINYVLLVSHRVLFLKLKKPSTLDVRHVAIVGNAAAAQSFARKIEAQRHWGIRLTGVYPLEQARSLLEAGGLDEMIMVADDGSPDKFREIFLLCEELGVTSGIVLNFFPHSLARLQLHQIDEFPLLSFSTTPTNQALMMVRRVMDIAVVSLFALPAVVIMAISAALIKITSPGPVLFMQERCGLNGRTFVMYKLRSMIDNAEQLRVELEALNEMDGPVFKSSRDPRVTPIGKVLRRFSIDEYPQLFNVLRGDMSIVGPRPPLPQEVARYERWQRRRLSMKPGLTCLWQVSGRSEVGFQEWMKLDLSYIDNWSLLLDLKILLKTVPVVLLGRGAR